MAIETALLHDLYVRHAAESVTDLIRSHGSHGKSSAFQESDEFVPAPKAIRIVPLPAPLRSRAKVCDLRYQITMVGYDPANLPQNVSQRLIVEMFQTIRQIDR